MQKLAIRLEAIHRASPRFLSTTFNPMPFRSFSKSLFIFIGYWVLIVPLAAFLLHRRDTDACGIPDPVLKRTLARGVEMTHWFNEVNLWEVEKLAYSYRTVPNDSLCRLAKAALQQVDSGQQAIQTLKNKLVPEAEIYPFELNWLAARLQQAGDSLRALQGTTSVITSNLEKLVFEPARSLQTQATFRFLKQASPDQIELYFNDLCWKLELAVNPLLRDLSLQINDQDDRFDEVCPVLSVEGCPQQGKPFSGEISLRPYSAHADNLTISINGRNMVAKEGLVEFRKTFPAAGAYPYRVRINVLNPLTKEVRTYEKEYSVQIANHE